MQRDHSAKTVTGLTISMMLLYLMQWGAQYIGYNYLPIYIDSLPFSTNSTTGLAVAVGAVTTSIAQPIWGRIADYAPTKNRILAIAFLLEALAGMIFFFELPNTWVLLFCIVVFYTPFLAPQALIDTIVVENVHKVKVRFGMLRCFSSGGAAVMAFLFGVIGNMTNQRAFTLFSLSAIAAIIPLQFMPATKGHAGKGKGEISYRQLFSNRRLVLFFSYGLVLFMCGSMVNTFFPIYLATEQGLNAGVEWFGLFMGVTILVEAALMFFGAPLFARMNPYLVFILPLMAGVLRMFITVSASTTADLLLYPISHALWFSPLWPKVAPFIQSIVPNEMRATGQSIWVIITCGAAPVIGSLLAGYLADTVGIRTMYCGIGVFMAIMTVVFGLLFLQQHRLDKKEGWHSEA